MLFLKVAFECGIRPWFFKVVVAGGFLNIVAAYDLRKLLSQVAFKVVFEHAFLLCSVLVQRYLVVDTFAIMAVHGGSKHGRDFMVLTFCTYSAILLRSETG